MNQPRGSWPQFSQIQCFGTRLVGFGTQVQVVLLRHFLQDSQVRRILQERVISDVCMFLYMFLWSLSDIFEGFRGYRTNSSSLALLFYSFFLPSPLLNTQNSQNYYFESRTLPFFLNWPLCYALVFLL